ncbi:MAG: HEPN domain-containing protein [Myxococcaceae bacterium]
MQPLKDIAFQWLRQVENDWLFAKSGLREGFYSHVCVLSQQAAEKSLKAILRHRKKELVRTHSLFELCRALRINGLLLQASSRLDLYYVSGRYPEAMAGTSAPYLIINKKQAEVALRDASLFIRKARGLLRVKRPRR